VDSVNLTYPGNLFDLDMLKLVEISHRCCRASQKIVAVVKHSVDTSRNHTGDVVG